MSAGDAQRGVPGVELDALERAVAVRTGEPVRRHETHGSVVFVSGERAYKLRKSVRFDFADLRELEDRRALANADAGLAEPLAPGMVLGPLDVVRQPDGAFALTAPGDPAAVDVVVEMRRYDDASTLRSLLTRGAADVQTCQAIGRRVAEFHRCAERRRDGADPRAMIDRNLEGVLPLLDQLLPARERFAVQRFLDAFLFAWADTLRGRTEAGLRLDGHGDLRAEHVLVGAAGITIVDRLEFEDLRIVDLADELAFLQMELLDLTGDEVLGDAILDGYREGGGTIPPGALLAFFGVHRALVRAKVALLRAAQLHGDAADDATAQAFHLLSVARRLSWRARGRLIVLVTGPPASGKSTLASALRERSRLPVLSSDAIRPRAGASGAADYSPQARASVYADLGSRAGAARSCVVDATFAEVDVQHAFLTALPRERRQDLVVVACHAPLNERIERARLRAQAGTSLSDADPDVVVQLEELSQVPVLPSVPRLAVDTSVPLAGQVDLVESWLDARLASSGD